MWEYRYIFYLDGIYLDKKIRLKDMESYTEKISGKMVDVKNMGSRWLEQNNPCTIECHNRKITSLYVHYLIPDVGGEGGLFLYNCFPPPCFHTSKYNVRIIKI